jgi:Undecaprenyl-phosphate glucose phosphotransferase
LPRWPLASLTSAARRFPAIPVLARRSQLRRQLLVPVPFRRKRPARMSGNGTPVIETAMNIHHAYALTSRIDTNRLLQRWTSLSRGAFSGAVLLSDVLVIVGMALLTGVAYHLAVYGDHGDLLSFLEVGSLTAIIFVIPNLFRGEYRLANFFAFRPHLRRSIRLWNVAFICLLALGFLAQISAVFSRGWMIIYYGSAICVLLALRYLMVQAMVLGSRSGLISAQRIFLFGTGRHVEDFINRHQPRTFGVSVVGCHFLTPVEAQASPQARQLALAQDLDAAIASARILEPDAIFLVMPWSDTDTIDRCAEALLRLPAEIHLAAEHILDRYEHVQLSKFGSVASLQLTRMPLSRLERIEKRAFDLVAASAGLILFTPVLIAAAILIKLDSPGPIFFLQHRFGFNQKPFRIIKLRTMRTLDDGPVIDQAKKDDPRITKVGAWLRRWNIDELPQLFNVVMGDMSLVGPRPHALSHDRDFEQRIARYARRHNVKPGITGWAQIHGFRGQTDTDEKMHARVEHDLYYIDNWSLALDLQIMLRTVLSRASYRNAY